MNGGTRRDKRTNPDSNPNAPTTTLCPVPWSNFSYLKRPSPGNEILPGEGEGQKSMEGSSLKRAAAKNSSPIPLLVGENQGKDKGKEAMEEEEEEENPLPGPSSDFNINYDISLPCKCNTPALCTCCLQQLVSQEGNGCILFHKLISLVDTVRNITPFMHFSLFFPFFLALKHTLLS
jgi:hypothetical protein